MKLRNKLALGYTIGFIVLVGISFISVYYISERNRKEQFYLRLKDRTISTYRILVEVDAIDAKMQKLFDRNTTNNLYEEKILVFDSTDKLIYNSFDDSASFNFLPIIKKLRNGESEVRLKQGQYEYLALKFYDRGHPYFAIAQAYDRYGKSKLSFLGWLLVATFVMLTIVFIMLSAFLSKIITRPVTRLTTQIESISPDNLAMRVEEPDVKDEVGFLAAKFNELLNKVENAFKFQYHFIHHLSHELKTPLAVMLANTESALAEGHDESLRGSLQFQKNALMELSYIINAMLDISRTENKVANVLSDSIRIDDLLFECMDEINYLSNTIQFDFRMDHAIEQGASLTVTGNSRMLKMALMNLLKNAVNFSMGEKPLIEIESLRDAIRISITNDGRTLDEQEQSRLFTHLFRGGNSAEIKGFGLGLVLTHRIVALHNGRIVYYVNNEGKNCFTLELKLAA